MYKVTISKDQIRKWLPGASIFTDTQTYISRVWMACSHLLQYWKHPLQLHNGWIFSILFCYGSWLRARYISTRNNSIITQQFHIQPAAPGELLIIAAFVQLPVWQKLFGCWFYCSPRHARANLAKHFIRVSTLDWIPPTLTRNIGEGQHYLGGLTMAGLGWQCLEADDANVSLITRLDIVWSLGWIN